MSDTGNRSLKVQREDLDADFCNAPEYEIPAELYETVLWGGTGERCGPESADA